MSDWTEYADRFGASTATTLKSQGDTIETTEHEENALGVQSELEARGAAYHPDVSGVISGLAPTEDDTNDEIDIASGVGYCNGRKCVGGVSVPLTGKASDTYYIVVDPSESSEADAYKAIADATFEAYADENKCLLLARCDWDGSSTISNFVDLRQWGVNLHEHIWCTAAEDTALSGFSTEVVYRWRASQDICLRRPSAIVVTCGTSGTTTIDIHTGAASSTTSIYSDSGDRISIAYDATDGSVARGGFADQNYKVSAGEVVEVHMDAVATGAAGASVVIPFTAY